LRLNFANTEDVVWSDTEDVVWTDTTYLTVLKYLIVVFGSKSPSATMNKKSPEAVISSSKPNITFELQEA